MQLLFLIPPTKLSLFLIKCLVFLSLSLPLTYDLPASVRATVISAVASELI